MTTNMIPTNDHWGGHAIVTGRPASGNSQIDFAVRERLSGSNEFVRSLDYDKIFAAARQALANGANHHQLCHAISIAAQS